METSLKDLLLGGLTATAGAAAGFADGATAAGKTQSTGNNGFDQFMKQAENRPETRPPYKSHPAQARPPAATARAKKAVADPKVTARPKTAAQPPGEQTEPTAAENEKIKPFTRADQTEAVTGTGEQGAEAGTATADTQATAADNDNNTIAQIAQALSLPLEAVQKALADLNLKPADLLQKANLTAFMTKAYQADDTTELLAIPNLRGALRQLNQTLAKLTPDTGTAAAPESAPAPVNASEQALAAAGTITAPVVNAAVGGLPVRDDNGMLPAPNGLPVTQTVTMVASAAAQQPGTLPQGDSQSQSQSQSQNQNQFGNPPRQPVSLDLTQPELLLTAVDRALYRDMPIANTTIAADNATRATAAQELITQIADRIKVDIAPGITEMKLTLKPEHLGDMTLKLVTENGIVTAHFVAESQRVKEVIEAQFNTLRSALLEQGVQVSQLSVSVNQGSQEQRMQQFTEGQQKSERRARRILGAQPAEEAEHDGDAAIITAAQAAKSSVEFTA